MDLEKINYSELNQEEKEKFLPSFFIAQILDVVSLEKLKFSKAEIAKTKLLRKWHFFLKKKNIAQLNELERFKLHQELEMFLPSFIFYLPQNLRFDWLIDGVIRKINYFIPQIYLMVMKSKKICK